MSEFVCRALGLKKTSHMGTLDPKVTGVLPITLGRACKLADYFIRHDKSYVGVLHTHKDCDIVELQSLIDDNFVGKIKQTPPHRSAVKVAERERTVYHWNLLEASDDGRDFLFEAKVEGGTYIRKLCSDLGEMSGGAHMGELRRTQAGVFDEGFGIGDLGFGRVVRLDEFEAAIGDEDALRKMIVPAEDAIREVLPVVEVDKSAVKALYTGKPLFTNNVVVREGIRDLGLGICGKGKKLKKNEVFAMFCGEKFIGVYRRTGEEIIFGRAEFVCN